MPREVKEVVAGIDLGTTNSVIAVPGHYPDHGEIFGDVTVIADDVGRLTQASAVCLVDGDDGVVEVVGDDAKDRASEGLTPVRFVKKYMGTTETFPLGDRMITPEEFSEKILRRMVDIAESALNVKIRRAVVTHPAYFDALAIEATKAACVRAGLDVEGRLAMEPVAAAMAYCTEDEDSEYRILVYDLGGGTFDVTLVERAGGAFRAISCGGDRELGGYNFDKKIADKMVETLRAKGFALSIDPDHPERDARWASLMHHAEDVKRSLSTKQRADASVPGVFKDDNGRAVALRYSLTRPDFLDLIAPELDRTIEQTAAVLRKAGIDPARASGEVKHLVLVGGSSRIPAIQDRLREEFGLEPQFDNDVLDLSVAVGAAMMAMSAGTTEGGVALGMLPAVTSDPVLVVDGQVQPDESRPKVAGLTVVVAGGASGEVRALTSERGGFFLEVDLAEDADNALELTIRAPDGAEILRKAFVVRHDRAAAAPTPAPPPMLPKRIEVETRSGLRTIAEEGQLLPFKATAPLRTTEELTEIPIDIFQEDVQLCTVLLAGFGQPVPANCRVELEVEIGADYAMTVAASVPSVGIRKAMDVRLPKMVIPTADELREEFARQERQFKDQLENVPPGEAKMRAGIEGGMVIKEIAALLGEERPERLQVAMLLKRLYLLTKKLPIAAALDPTRDEMARLFDGARGLLPAAIERRPSLREQRLDATFDALRAEADAAAARNDATAWARVAGRVREIAQMLEPPAPVQPAPPAPLVKMALAAEIRKARDALATARQRGRISPDDAGRCAADLDAAQAELDAVSLADNQQALADCQRIYQQRIAPALERSDPSGKTATTGTGGPKVDWG